MTNTVSPATIISVGTWTNLNIYKNLAIIDGEFTPSWSTNFTRGYVEYLGDANGKAVSPLGPQVGVSPLASTVIDLSEEITRADGTKLTVLALLDSIAIAAIPTV